MTGYLQDGIYYDEQSIIGNSLCVLFLKFSSGTNATNIANSLNVIWTNLQELEKGIIKELDTNPKNRSTGNLTILLGYGPKIFLYDGIKKKKPVDFQDKWLFQSPNKNGGGFIMNGSRISYAKFTNFNHAINDDIIIQFIADTEFHTCRALLETWKLINNLNRNSGDKSLEISKYYTGFHSITGRGLIGFHDGVSNLKSSERYEQIAIKPNNGLKDSWTENGTYMTFMRTIINLETWEQLTREQQEIVIGRDKKTGCPIIGVNKDGKPVKEVGCPVFGTYEVTDPGNEHFRDRPEYGNQFLPHTVSDKLLQNSHISVTNPVHKLTTKKQISFKIFRQGFHYLEHIESPPFFRGGLNFISFQNTPEKIYQMLTYKIDDKTFINSSMKNMLNLNDFFTVTTAGTFFIPPRKDKILFPGIDIFM